MREETLGLCGRDGEEEKSDYFLLQHFRRFVISLRYFIEQVVRYHQ